jgi:hypothetical protein
MAVLTALVRWDDGSESAKQLYNQRVCLGKLWCLEHVETNTGGMQICSAGLERSFIVQRDKGRRYKAWQGVGCKIDSVLSFGAGV